MVVILHAQDLLPEELRRLEGIVLCNGEHAQEAFAGPEVVIPDGCVVLLARRVEDVDLHFLAVEHDLLAVTVGFGGLVVLHELVVHELQREGGLADAARAHHDHLVEGGRRRVLLGAGHLAGGFGGVLRGG